MTMVFKEAPLGHPSRPLHDKTMVVLDLDDNNQMIWYDDGRDDDQENPSKKDISMKVFEQRDVVQLRCFATVTPIPANEESFQTLLGWRHSRCMLSCSVRDSH